MIIIINEEGMLVYVLVEANSSVKHTHRKHIETSEIEGHF